MPEIHIYAVEGRTLEQKRQLVRDITDAVVRNFAVPADVVVIQIIEAPKTSKARGGVLFSEQPPKP
jgi:4-oxalocrotonate tautomerase